MSREWRNKSHRTLFTRPIYKAEYPSLTKQMAEDGLTIRLVNKGNGYEWFMADYKLPTTSVREVWGLSPHQMRSLIDWLLGNDSELISWE